MYQELSITLYKLLLNTFVIKKYEMNFTHFKEKHELTMSEQE